MVSLKLRYWLGGKPKDINRLDEYTKGWSTGIFSVVLDSKCGWKWHTHSKTWIEKTHHVFLKWGDCNAVQVPKVY